MLKYLYLVLYNNKQVILSRNIGNDNQAQFQTKTP